MPKAAATAASSIVGSSGIIVGVTNGVVNILEGVTTGTTITKRKLHQKDECMLGKCIH